MAAIGALLALCYVVVTADVVRYAHAGKAYGYWVGLDGEALVVTKVLDTEPVARLLKAGDRIVVVNGHSHLPAWLMNRQIPLPAATTS